MRRNGDTSPDKLLESVESLSKEMNLTLCQQMDSLINVVQAQTRKAINSAINERVIPEIQTQ